MPFNPDPCPGCGWQPLTTLATYPEAKPKITCPQCRGWELQTGLLIIPLAGRTDGKPLEGPPVEIVSTGLPYWKPVEPDPLAEALAQLRRQLTAPAPRNLATPSTNDYPEIRGVLRMIPGGYVYRDNTMELSGDAWDVLREFVLNRDRWQTARQLLATVWKDRPGAADQQGKDAIKAIRESLKQARKKASLRRAGDPIPCVDHGNNLAWKLDLEQI